MTDFDPTDTGPHPDAELLAMGAELDGIAADWHRQRALDAQPDGPSSDGAWDDILGRVYAFADRVMALHARTLAGFAVQARAASLAAHDLFDLPDDGHERMFIECACRFAGVTPVPLEYPPEPIRPPVS
jgi:hypothetical protein